MKRLYVSLVVLVCSSNFLWADINFANKHSTLKFTGANSSFNLETPLSSYSGTLELKDNAATTITSLAAGTDIVTFNKGCLITGNVRSNITGVLDPDSTDTINLTNGDILDVRSGVIVQAVSVANGATATVLGQPRFNGALTLGNAASTLNMGIVTTLDQNVDGLGTLSLLDDLTVERGITFPDNVAMNGKTLHFAGGTLDAHTNTGGGIIELHSDTTISAPITLGTGADQYFINGNGYVLTFTGTGAIIYNGSTSLTVSDIHIEGLNTTNSLRGTGEIRFTKTTLELSADLTRSDGDYYFAGDGSNVIVNGDIFQISGVGNSITVDGVIVTFEQLDGSENNPFAQTAGGTISKINGGDIRIASGTGGGGGGGGGSSIVISTSPFTLIENYFLSTSINIELDNGVPAVPMPITVDGNGHLISFPSQSGAFLIIDENVQATFQDVVFKDWNPDGISYGAANSTITFGDDIILNMGEDLTIASGDRSWDFAGDAVIDGHGHILRIEKSQGVNVTGAKTLTLQNMRIISEVVDGLKCLSATSHIRLVDVEVETHDADFNFDTGHLDIIGKVNWGGGSLSSALPTIFQFSSTGNLTLGNFTNQELGSLVINENTTFHHNSSVKTNIDFAYPTCALHLNRCTFLSSTTGLTLDGGTVNVQDKVDLVTTAGVGEEVEFRSTMNINLLSGSVLDVQGNIRYIT